MLTWFKNLFIGTLYVLDEEGNIIWGKDPTIPAAGNPHYTISQRLSEMRNNGSKFACWGCKVLTWIQNKIFKTPGDHCTDAMQDFPPDLPTNG